MGQKFVQPLYSVLEFYIAFLQNLYLQYMFRNPCLGIRNICEFSQQSIRLLFLDKAQFRILYPDVFLCIPVPCGL